MSRWSRTAIGIGLLAAGAAMLVLPGPGLVAIAGGLSVLGREYAWARSALARFHSATERLLGTPVDSAPSR